MSQIITQTERYKNWQEVMRDWEASSDTQESYCRSRNINYRKFKSWRSRIATDKKKEQIQQIQQMQQVLQMPQSQVQQVQQLPSNDFIPLKLKPEVLDQTSLNNNQIRIELQAGIKIFIPVNLG